jgi:hypothetical protein
MDSVTTHNIAQITVEEDQQLEDLEKNLTYDDIRLFREISETRVGKMERGMKPISTVRALWKRVFGSAAPDTEISDSEWVDLEKSINFDAVSPAEQINLPKTVSCTPYYG